MSSRRESEFARLQQLLREADQRAQEADERAEQERQRAQEAERNRKEADHRAELERKHAKDEQRNRQEAESRAQIERKKTRPTTFEEYIRACHTHLSKPLRIQTDKSLSAEDFSSIQYLKELGQDLCDQPLASEKDLEAYQRLAVKRLTTHIISHLQQVEEARRELNLSGGIIFENHANTLSDGNEEVQQSLQDLRISNKGQVSSSNPKPRNADQICVYKEADGTQSLTKLAFCHGLRRFVPW